MKATQNNAGSSLGPSVPDLEVIRRNALLAVVYADLFEFALTHEELHARVIGSRVDRARLDCCLRTIGSDVLVDTGEYVCLRGREHLIAIRRDRNARARALWKEAHRFAGWLRVVPFVRSVAVSGSLAVGNAGRASDVDLFCITAANRLWISRLFIVPISKLTRFTLLFPAYLCPNYLLDEACLRVPDSNLFTAHEIRQAVPVWGGSVHARFLRANRWTSKLLPNIPETSRGRVGEPASERPAVTRLIENLLAGGVGDRVNHSIFRLFSWAYQRRAARRGWRWSRIASAYQLGRYTVPEGGYADVVARLFRRRVREIMGHAADDVVGQLFPFDTVTSAPKDAVHDWPRLFAQEYSSAA